MTPDPQQQREHCEHYFKPGAVRWEEGECIHDESTGDCETQLKEGRCPLTPAVPEPRLFTAGQAYDIAQQAARTATLAENKRCVKILEDYRFGLDYPDCPPGDCIKKLGESLRQHQGGEQ